MANPDMCDRSIPLFTAVFISKIFHSISFQDLRKSKTQKFSLKYPLKLEICIEKGKSSYYTSLSRMVMFIIFMFTLETNMANPGMSGRTIPFFRTKILFQKFPKLEIFIKSSIEAKYF